VKLVVVLVTDGQDNLIPANLLSFGMVMAQKIH